jgi:hypothetical protein
MNFIGCPQQGQGGGVGLSKADIAQMTPDDEVVLLHVME